MPIPTSAEIFASLHAAWRMLLRDERAVDRFDATPRGFWASFFCAVVVLPPYVLLVVLDRTAVSVDAGWGRLVAVETIAYVIGWTAWPVIMSYIVPLLDRDSRYIRYIVAYNWSTGPQMLVMLVAMLLAYAGIVPPLVGVVALVVMLAYHTFIAGKALDIPTLPAVALVLGEFFLSRFVYAARLLMLQ